MTTPLLIGGATTSRKHTSIKIAPHYERAHRHARGRRLAGRWAWSAELITEATARRALRATNAKLQARDRERYAAAGTRSLPRSGSRARRAFHEIDWAPRTCPPPKAGAYAPSTTSIETLATISTGRRSSSPGGSRDVYPRVLETRTMAEAARDLFDDAQPHARAHPRFRAAGFERAASRVLPGQRRWATTSVCGAGLVAR